MGNANARWNPAPNPGRGSNSNSLTELPEGQISKHLRVGKMKTYKLKFCKGPEKEVLLPAHPKLSKRNRDEENYEGLQVADFEERIFSLEKNTRLKVPFSEFDVQVLDKLDE